ncbi:hypothetical protein Bca4012_041271 [Brassica carinata]
MSISDLLFGFCDYSTAITCARFGFILDEELKQAASSEEVRVALGKEGIGNEIDLMISGDGAVSVVMNLSDMKLFGVVFALPSSSEPAPSEKFSRYISFLLLTFGNLANRVP